MTQKMKVCKTKKTTTVCKTLSPSFNQSFDFKLTEKSLSQTFLTLHLKQVKQFPVKGRQHTAQHSITRFHDLLLRCNLGEHNPGLGHVLQGQWLEAVEQGGGQAQGEGGGAPLAQHVGGRSQLFDVIMFI